MRRRFSVLMIWQWCFRMRVASGAHSLSEQTRNSCASKSLMTVGPASPSILGCYIPFRACRSPSGSTRSISDRGSSSSKKRCGLPVTFRLGAAYKLWNDALTLTTDLIRPSDNHIATAVGAAYTIGNLLHLRTGYKYKIGGNDLGAISGLASGFGLTLRQFQLDYALIPFGVLGLTPPLLLSCQFLVRGRLNKRFK